VVEADERLTAAAGATGIRRDDLQGRPDQVVVADRQEMSSACSDASPSGHHGGAVLEIARTVLDLVSVVTSPIVVLVGSPLHRRSRTARRP